MDVEYDPQKSDENRRKHGMDFEEAQELWKDLALVEFPSRYASEPRWLLIGKIDERHWSAVFTRRGENKAYLGSAIPRGREESL